MEVQVPFYILTWWIYRGLRDFFFTGNHVFFQPNMGLSCRKKSTNPHSDSIHLESYPPHASRLCTLRILEHRWKSHHFQDNGTTSYVASGQFALPIEALQLETINHTELNMLLLSTHLMLSKNRRPPMVWHLIFTLPSWPVDPKSPME